VVAEVPPAKRAIYFLCLIGISEVALVLFGLTPAPYNLLFLFANGLPIGLVFGLMLSFLEGRCRTEALAAGLCASFVIADGAAKSCGTWLMERGVPEVWMPSVSGVLFVPAVLLFGWMLSRIPPQSQEDIENRSVRATMDAKSRRALWLRFAPGLALLVAIYTLTGVLRGIRADFSREIWLGLHYQVDAALYTKSELIVALLVSCVIGMLVLIRDNRRAFFVGLLLSAVGFILVAFALLANGMAAISPFSFMVLIGFGLYLPYIAIHAAIYERLLALSREPGTISYLMYIADSSSYGLLVSVLFVRNLGHVDSSQMLPFFLQMAWGVSAMCLLMTVPAWLYFRRKLN
jgi:hypothetical protein